MKFLKIIFTIVFLAIVIHFCLNPLIIFNSEEPELKKQTFSKGDVVKPFKDFNFDTGNYTAYLIINDNIDVSAEMPNGKVFETNNTELLKRIQKNVAFEYTGSDMATVENKLLIYKNEKLVFSTDIVLDNNRQGFQNRDFGWIKVNEKHTLSYYCKDFKRVYRPLIIL